jgi:hypothetical protein
MRLEERSIANETMDATTLYQQLLLMRTSKSGEWRALFERTLLSPSDVDRYQNSELRQWLNGASL